MNNFFIGSMAPIYCISAFSIARMPVHLVKEALILADTDQIKKYLPDDRFLLWEHAAENVLDNLIVIIAPPKKGKTELAKSILRGVSHDLPVRPLVIICAPNNTFASKNDKEWNFIPDEFWFEKSIVDDTFFLNLLAIQNKRQFQCRIHGSLSSLTNYVSQLYDSFDDVDFSEFDRINAHYAALCKHGITSEQSKEYRRRIIAVMKQLICDNAHHMLELEKQKSVLKYWHYSYTCPHLIMIFDDMGIDMREMKQFNYLCTRYRHAKITMINISHAWSLMMPIVRTSVDVAIMGNAMHAAVYINENRGLIKSNLVSHAIDECNEIINSDDQSFAVIRPKALSDIVMATGVQHTDENYIEYTSEKVMIDVRSARDNSLENFLIYGDRMNALGRFRPKKKGNSL